MYFQSAKGADPLHSGILSLPVVITTASTGVATGAFIHRTGRYLEPMWVGIILLTIGTGLYIKFNATSSIGNIIGFQILTGLGSGCLFEPPLIALQAMVKQEDTATATSTMGFLRGLSVALSVVVGGVAFQNSMESRSSVLRNAGLPSNITGELNGANAAANVGLVHLLADRPAQQLVVREAFAWSIRNMWIMYTCVSFVGVVASFFVKKQYLVQEHTETITGLKKTDRS